MVNNNLFQQQARGVVIAGTQSGVGKTTVALGLMAACRRRGLVVQPFKIGPDFIDPGHHTQVAGRAGRNLDGWMLTKDANLAVFQRHTADAGLAVVEGVMGLFDGYDGRSEAGSTAQMAKWLGLPVVLVVDARAMARSAAALVHGFASFDPELQVAGVIFNRVGSPAHLDYLQQALQAVPQARCWGGIWRDQALTIPERHLGLTTAQDHPLEPGFIDRLADLMEASLDLDALLASLPRLPAAPPPTESAPGPAPAAVRLGVARDQAFCFYYPDNLDWLRHFGAELVFFSPLHDRGLPPDLAGIYLGGGYPELFAAPLAANAAMQRNLREHAAAGRPIYAECGGLMYLGEEIADPDGKRYTMAGLLPLKFRMLPRLKALGYREITLTVDSLLGPAGTQARGHEFHYSELADPPGPLLRRCYRLTARKHQEVSEEGYSLGRVLASYVHLHFGSNPEVARHLVDHCRFSQENQ